MKVYETQLDKMQAYTKKSQKKALRAKKWRQRWEKHPKFYQAVDTVVAALKKVPWARVFKIIGAVLLVMLALLAMLVGDLTKEPNRRRRY